MANGIKTTKYGLSVSELKNEVRYLKIEIKEAEKKLEKDKIRLRALKRDLRHNEKRLSNIKKRKTKDE